MKDPWTEDIIRKSTTNEETIEKDPLNYTLWHEFCNALIVEKGLEETIRVCELETKKHPNSPFPLIDLSNLYAAKGDYKSAIDKSMEVFKLRREDILFAFSNYQTSKSASLEG
jgi:hypothetical protein